MNIFTFIVEKALEVYDWFSAKYPGAVNLLANFWNWLWGVAANVLQNAISTATQKDNVVRSDLSLSILHTAGQLTQTIDRTKFDLLKYIDGIPEPIRTFIQTLIFAIADQLKYIIKFITEQILAVIAFFESLFKAADELVKGLIKGVETFVQQMFASIGAATQFGITVLNMLATDPIGFIAFIMVEIILPLVFYELARGIAPANVDIGAPPIFKTLDLKMKLDGSTPIGDERLQSKPITPIKITGKGFDAVNHPGVDLSATKGQSVYAAHNATVSTAGWGGSTWGNHVILKGGSWITRYAHLDRVLVKSGDKVNAGSVIGQAGNTGSASGVFLYFETILNGKYVNPMNYL